MDQREFEAGPWRITVSKGHILKSVCERESGGCSEEQDKCPVCRFGSELELPALPEMVFPRNALRLEHSSGCGLEFTALEGLKMVDATQDPLKVAVAEAWSRSRSAELKEVKDSVKMYDWTYTSSYRGTLTGVPAMQVHETDERIDYGRLKQQEQIYFYDDVILYEDELADHGVAELRVKIRVMATGFFILLRFFLRVDDVLVRLIDTRLYQQAGSEHVLREFSIKEGKTAELKVPVAVLTDPHKLSDILPVKELIVHKLTLQKQTT